MNHGNDGDVIDSACPLLLTFATDKCRTNCIIVFMRTDVAVASHCL